MARGIWVSPDEFVAFSEPQKSLTAQIASRSRAIDFYGLGMYLPNPDPILKAQGRDIRIYRELRTDPLVGGCIRRRKAALKSLERGLERGHASARVFRFIRDMLDDLDLSRIIGEMSDAVLYGYQPCEIMWGRSVRSWAVTDIVGKPPEWFQFDTDNCLRFRARDAGVEGELLSPSKFVVPAQDASYDNPYGFPDLSMCFWPVAFKKGGMKFWLRFAEKFGSPWVIGKHPRGANDAEIEKLLDSMEQMVEDAVAAIPDDSSIELRAADGKADSSEVFRELITLSRSEISIALLGQNQTTEANSNKASAQAGLEVTADIRDADADIIQAAVNQVIRTVVTLNFGDVPCPVWAMWEQEAIDDTRATRDEKLTRAGLRLTPQYFKREYQLQDGDIDETPPSERQNNMLPLSFAEAIDADIQAQQQLDDALDILMNGGALNVTADIRDADADIIQAAVNQVIRTVVTLNFGDVPCPVWAMWEQEAIDDTRATRDEKLTRAGLRLTPQYFKREYQLQDGDIDETPPSERQNNMLPLSFAEAIDADIQAQQQLDDALDILMNGGALNGTLEPVLAPLFRRVENGVNPSELLGELAELYPQMNTDDLQERLARILFVANIRGRLHERDNG